MRVALLLIAFAAMWFSLGAIFMAWIANRLDGDQYHIEQHFHTMSGGS